MEINNDRLLMEFSSSLNALLCSSDLFSTSFEKTFSTSFASAFLILYFQHHLQIQFCFFVFNIVYKNIFSIIRKNIFNIICKYIFNSLFSTSSGKTFLTSFASTFLILCFQHHLQIHFCFFIFNIVYKNIFNIIFTIIRKNIFDSLFSNTFVILYFQHHLQKHFQHHSQINHLIFHCDIVFNKQFFNFLIHFSHLKKICKKRGSANQTCAWKNANRVVNFWLFVHYFNMRFPPSYRCILRDTIHTLVPLHHSSILLILPCLICKCWIRPKWRKGVEHVKNEYRLIVKSEIDYNYSKKLLYQ
jgi:hypothetical protein